MLRCVSQSATLTYAHQCALRNMLCLVLMNNSEYSPWPLQLLGRASLGATPSLHLLADTTTTTTRHTANTTDKHANRSSSTQQQQQQQQQHAVTCAQLLTESTLLVGFSSGRLEVWRVPSGPRSSLTVSKEPLQVTVVIPSFTFDACC
jgi:hypothetical protein